MKKKLIYIPPEIEIVEVAIEKGFATSPDVPISDWGTDQFGN